MNHTEEPASCDHDLSDPLLDVGVVEDVTAGEPPPRDLVELALLAAQICGTPAATITLRGDRGPLTVVDVGEATASVEPAFRVSTELVSVRDVPVGTLSVTDSRERTLATQQLDALAMLGARIVDALEHRLTTLRLEEAVSDLADAQEQIRRSRDQLSLFAGKVSHDLRTPLTGVSMCAQMLVDHPAVQGDEEAAWLAERAVSSTQRLDRMIGELLARATADAPS